MFFEYNQLQQFLEQACAHYEKTAPALSEWLDELYVSLSDAPLHVTVFELLQLQQLQMDGEWEPPTFAQNRWYKVRALKGQSNGVYDH